MHIAQFFRVNVPNLDLVLGVDIEQNPLALGKLQEPGREWGGGLEQSLRVVATEQLDLPIPGGDGEDVEDGVVGEEGGVGGDAVVEGQPRAHVLGAQTADASDILLLGGLLDELLDEHGWPIRGADEGRCPDAAGRHPRTDQNWPRSATPFFTGGGSRPRGCRLRPVQERDRGGREEVRNETDDEGKAVRETAWRWGCWPVGVAGGGGGVGVRERLRIRLVASAFSAVSCTLSSL